MHARVVPDGDVPTGVLEGEATQGVDHLTLDDILCVPTNAHNQQEQTLMVVAWVARADERRGTHLPDLRSRCTNLLRELHETTTG